MPLKHSSRRGDAVGANAKLRTRERLQCGCDTSAARGSGRVVYVRAMGSPPRKRRAEGSGEAHASAAARRRVTQLRAILQALARRGRARAQGRAADGTAAGGDGGVDMPPEPVDEREPSATGPRAPLPRRPGSLTEVNRSIPR